jgi:hypothetical protein
MTGPFPSYEWWGWLIGGILLAAFALYAEHSDREADRRAADDLRDRLIRQEGMTAGAFLAVNQKLDAIAASNPQAGREVTEIKKLLVPIKLRFEYRDPFLQKTPVDNGTTRLYIRLLPECSSAVENCLGRLLSIDHQIGTRWEPTAYNEAVPLTWANRRIGPTTIEPQIGPYLDVFYIDDRNQSIVPCVTSTPDEGLPLRMMQSHFHPMLRNREENLRLTVQATGSEPIYLKVRLRSQWDNPLVEVLPNGSCI